MNDVQKHNNYIIIMANTDMQKEEAGYILMNSCMRTDENNENVQSQ